MIDNDTLIDHVFASLEAASVLFDCDDPIDIVTKIIATIEPIIRADEREACASVLDARVMQDNNREDMEARLCAAAIRARGT